MAVDEPILWEELTAFDIEAQVKAAPMVIWCLGATEQHGPHLPLGTDTIDVWAVAREVSARTRVPLLPPVSIGSSQNHGRRFLGTLALRPQTLMAVVENVCEWLYASGVRKVLLLNGHGGNEAPLHSSVMNLLHDLPLDFQVKVLLWPDAIGDAMYQDVPEGSTDIHAGWSETAMVLAVRPELVHMDRAVDEPILDPHFEYTIGQISRSGVLGANTRGATVGDGQALLAKAADAITTLVTEMLNEASRPSDAWEKNTSTTVG